MASAQGAHGKDIPSPVITPAAGREAIRNPPPSYEEVYLCVWDADGDTAKLRKDMAAGNSVGLRPQDTGSVPVKGDIGPTNSRNGSGTTAGRRPPPRYDAPENETQARGSAGSAPRCEQVRAGRQLPRAVGFKSFVWHTESLPKPPLIERQFDSADSSPSSNNSTPLPPFEQVQRLVLEEKVRPNMHCCRVTVSMPARTGFIQARGERRPLLASQVAGSGTRKKNTVDNGRATRVAGEADKGICKPEIWEGILQPDSRSNVVEATAADAADAALNTVERGGRGRRRKGDRSFVRTKSMSALHRANAAWNEIHRVSHRAPPPYEESCKDSKRTNKTKRRVARAKVHPSESGSESEPGAEGDDHWEAGTTFAQYNLTWGTE